MYNYQEIKNQIAEIKAEFEALEQDLKANKPDLLKFYKKQNQRAGSRLRRNLASLITKIQSMRLDIKRTMKEKQIFKGTDLE